MRLFAATSFALLLASGSLALLAWASHPTDLRAIAGGTGVAVAAALLALTLLAWRWRDGNRRFTTPTSDPGFYDELAAAFDDSTDGYDDAAMRVAR